MAFIQHRLPARRVVLGDDRAPLPPVAAEAIANNILERSRQLARRERITLRSMVEEGLGLVLERHQARRRMAVKAVTFRGKGVTPQFRNAGWDRIRKAAYEGRGS